MSRRAISVRVWGATALLVASFFAAPAAADTVVLDSPGSEVVDAFIRAGSYANQVHDTGELVTKANSNPSYVRRALLKFDTHNRVPARAKVQSATLTLTLKRSEASARTLDAHRVTTSFDERASTWHRRKSGLSWKTAGGDLGARYASATVGTAGGTRVKFNLTSLVQKVVNGAFGTRYTRVALVDAGRSSASSYKAFYSSEASDPSVRPRLAVVYGSGSSTPAPQQSTSTSTISSSGGTTVVLAAPGSEVVDSFIRAGSYANNVHNDDVLVTKANSNASYVRRALLKFDTQNRVPANATVQSAKLTLTLRRSESSTRTLSAYRVTTSFDETGATWNRRKKDASWTTAGGDLGARYATASVGTSAGAKVEFDITALVQAAVKGQFGSSRYTRLALVDGGSSSATSYKEFHSSEASDPGVRPKLTVVYGGSSSPAPAPAPTDTSSPSPDPDPPTSSSTLKVLHWNIHYGIGTDGKYGIDKHVDWIVKINPDLVSLNEVEKYVSGHGNENQPALFASKLSARTGKTWYYHFAQRYGNWSSNGGGNLILSRFPIQSKSQLAMSYDRSAALATVIVNGRTINFVSTHLASESSGYRSTQIKQLMSWARGFAEQRIIAGDFNAGLVNVPYMEDEYDDGWTSADKLGTAQDYAGNTRWGATHNYKIDFVFESEGASKISVRSARVYDTRDSNGKMPSDHKPLLVTFNVQ